MFTGLIREMATVESFQNGELKLKAKFKPKIGDSIAVNGVCLTVTKLNQNGFSLKVAKETAQIVPPQKFANQVHIEPAMQMGDRLEGHIVQGHIDCIGEITDINKFKDGVDFFIKVPKEQIKFIVPKGSIALDGVSLTVNEVFNNSFRLTIIPHTIENTLFKTYKIGSKVNIETDMFARYIAHFLSHSKDKNGIGWGEIDAISMSY